MAVLLGEAQIGIAGAGVAYELLEGTPLVTLPIRIIEVLVEDQDRARLEPVAQLPEHGRGRGIDVAIDVDEGDRLARMLREEARQRVGEPAGMQPGIRGHRR